MYWALLSPFLMLCIYTLAFGTIMGGRWPESRDAGASFSIVLFAGLIVHGFFAECLTRAPVLVTSNVNFVKKIVFPLEILPWVSAGSALFHAATNLLVFVVLRFVMDGEFSWTTVYFPAVLAPLAILALAVGWFLAALGVYLRDVAQVIGVVSTALLFLSSALVPVDALPARYRWIFELNPLTFIIDQARDVLMWNRAPDWIGLTIYAGVALVALYAAYAFFDFTRKGFADVL